MDTLEHNDIVLRAISQELRPPAADDADIRVWSDGFLYEGAEMSQGATHIVHHDVVGSLQKGLNNVTKTYCHNYY